MMIKINRKKQFASSIVPFYIIINMNQEEIMQVINNGGEIVAYPIKRGETVIFNTKDNAVKFICINANFRNNKQYPLCFTEQLEIVEDSTLLLEQITSFKTIEIKLSINNELEIDENKTMVYDI